MPTPKNLLIYEDRVARSKRFLPLTYTRCLPELRSGALTGIERCKALYPEARIHLHTTPELKAVVEKRYGLQVNVVPSGETILVNARALFSPKAKAMSSMEAISSIMAQRLEAGQPMDIMDGIDQMDASLGITALWDIIHANTSLLEHDISLFKEHLVSTSAKLDHPGVHFVNPENIFLAKDARVDPGVVLDASEGAILIEHGARVMSNAVIIGPVAVGKDSLIKVGAKIYGGTTIGPVSKIGGEVENSIVQGYSNKQHDGYLGHSFLGEWVNLGADTNTSDLKNDYGSVRVTIEGEEFDSKSMFVGLMMGDHSKSAINTQFNTGTAVGVSSNVFDSGFPPKWIPSFSWGGAQGFSTYRFEKAIEVARTVTARRKVTLSSEDEALLRSIYNTTQQRSA